MRTKLCSAAATAVALALFVAGAPAFGHKAHEEGEAAEAPPAPPPAAAEAPAPAREVALSPPDLVVREIGPHDHGEHASAPAAHTGSAPAKAQTNVPKPLAWLGKFHPPLTHFPIALLTAAALAELLFLRSGESRFEHAVHFAVWCGALAAVAAATLGWLFAGLRLVDDEWLMTAHRWAGTSTAIAACGLLYMLERAKRSTFRSVLFASAGLVGATGFLGGALLYGLDHYAW